MRREEGYTERGETRRVPIGLWANVLLGLAFYGPIVVGGVLGWRASDSLWAAGLGAAIGLVVAMVLGLLTIPLKAVLPQMVNMVVLIDFGWGAFGHRVHGELKIRPGPLRGQCLRRSMRGARAARWSAFILPSTRTVASGGE
jgi:hypothetical protein